MPIPPGETYAPEPPPATPADAAKRYHKAKRPRRRGSPACRRRSLRSGARVGAKNAARRRVATRQTPEYHPVSHTIPGRGSMRTGTRSIGLAVVAAFVAGGLAAQELK